MKRIPFIFSFFIIIILNAQELSVMTYNIKLDYPTEGENSWSNRKSFFIGQLQFHEPDIFGVQGAMPNQMKDMDNLLTNYSFVGVGRDDGKDGENGKTETFWQTEALYNLEKDISESKNVVQEYPEIAKELKSALEIFDRTLKKEARPTGISED